MAQATTNNMHPNIAAQFKTSGYVLSEDSEMFLKDLFAAMEATAFAYDMDQGGAGQNFDLTGDQVAAVLRSYARLGKSIMSGVPFAKEAMARKRED